MQAPSLSFFCVEKPGWMRIGLCLQNRTRAAPRAAALCKIFAANVLDIRRRHEKIRSWSGLLLPSWGQASGASLPLWWKTHLIPRLTCSASASSPWSLLHLRWLNWRALVYKISSYQEVFLWLWSSHTIPCLWWIDEALLFFQYRAWFVLSHGSPVSRLQLFSIPEVWALDLGRGFPRRAEVLLRLRAWLSQPRTACISSSGRSGTLGVADC